MSSDLSALEYRFRVRDILVCAQMLFVAFEIGRAHV